MEVFVLEISGTPVLSIEAESLQEVQDGLLGPDSPIDLSAVEVASKPLWDGVAPRIIREASYSERMAYLEAKNWADANRTKRPDERWAVFVNAVTKRP